MKLKATIACTCGAKYNLISDGKSKSAICPSCSKPFVEAEKLIKILEIAANMNVGNERMSDSDVFNVFKPTDGLTITSL